MPVHVDQPGHQGHASGIDDNRAIRWLYVSADGPYDAVRDQDTTGIDHAANAIDHASIGNEEIF